MDAATATINLQVSDASGRHWMKAPNVSGDQTVGELVKRLLAKMGLVQHDVEGRHLRYRARLEREKRHLHGFERVGEALRPDDHVVLQPSVDAG